MVARAGLIKLDQARPVPQFVDRITIHQRHVPWQMTSTYGSSCVPQPVVCFQFFHPCTSSPFFFYVPFFILIFQLQAQWPYGQQTESDVKIARTKKLKTLQLWNRLHTGGKGAKAPTQPIATAKTAPCRNCTVHIPPCKFSKYFTKFFKIYIEIFWNDFRNVLI